MDYFFVGNHVGSNGLIDLYLPLKFKVKKWTFGLTPHYFMAAATVSTLDTENMKVKDFDDTLGTEIDFTIGFVISKAVKINGGYSQMFATQTMQVLKYPESPNATYYQNTNNWAWLMITVKPTFFNSNKKKKK